MKKNRARPLIAMTAAAVIAAGALPVPAFAQASRSAKIYSATGAVSVKRGGDKLLPAFEGMRLEEGDIIISAADSSAVIEIDADKTVSVDENTEIALSTLAGTAEEGQTGVSVFFGNIVNSIQNKLSKGSTFETETPTAIMGVRGTTYLVGQPLQTAPSVVVANGSVQTDTLDGSGALVEPGYVFEAGAQAPVPVSVERLTEYGPAAVSALANGNLVEALNKHGANVAAQDLVAAAAQRRDERRREAAQAQPASEAPSEETYFTDTGAQITGAAQAQIAAGDAAQPEPAQADSQPAPAETPAPNEAPAQAPQTQPAQATEPAPGAAAAETPQAAPQESATESAPLYNTTANNLSESKTAASTPAGGNGDSSGGGQGDRTPAQTPSTNTGPGNSDFGHSNGNGNHGNNGNNGNGGGGGNGNDHSRPDDDWVDQLPDPPSEREQHPKVKDLTSIKIDDDYIKIQWEAITDPKYGPIKYVVTFNEGVLPPNLGDIIAIEQDGDLRFFKIPIQNINEDAITSVTVEVRSLDGPFKNSEPSTIPLVSDEVPDDGDPNKERLDEIEVLNAEWLQGNGSLVASWKRHEKDQEDGFKYHVLLVKGETKATLPNRVDYKENDKAIVTISLKEINQENYTDLEVYVSCPGYRNSNAVKIEIPERDSGNSPDHANGDEQPDDNSESENSNIKIAGLPDWLKGLKGNKNGDQLTLFWPKSLDVHVFQGSIPYENITVQNDICIFDIETSDLPLSFSDGTTNVLFDLTPDIITAA